MELKIISDKKIWEDFFESCQEKTFLQSWNWGEFQEKQNNKIWRFGIFENNEMVSVTLVIKISAKRGTFLFIPHGPVIKDEEPQKEEILKVFLNKLKSIAVEQKAVFIRFVPIWPETEENINIFKRLGFKKAPMHSSAYEATWKLNITLPEERLLANMRKTTRYLIKKVSENKDIEIEINSNLKSIVAYQKLNKEVAKRQKFVAFSDKFIKDEFEIFNKNSEAVFIFGKYKGEVVAGAMIIFWQKVAFYHQAASLGKFAKYSIPYLLQWQAIKEAKKRGCQIYDFWGFTDPKIFSKHPWAGPTLFKMGFGGFSQEYVKTQDYIISHKYWLNYIVEKIRKIKRGL